MRTFRNLALFFLFSVAGFGQAAPQLTASQITFPVLTTLAQPSGAIALVGNPGPQTYFYWLVANYPLGPLAPVLVGSLPYSPAVLSSGNYNQIVPTYPTGVTSLDLLRTTSAIPPIGACACAVSAAVTSGAINDQSNSLSAYTVQAQVNVNALAATLTNEVVSAGTVHLLYRQNGSLIADLAIGGSGGSGNVVGPGGSTVGHFVGWNNTTGTLTLDLGFGVPIPLNKLAASSITVTAGTGLSGGGSVSLGGSTTLNINNPAAINITGNAATATQASAAPSLCPSGQAAQGILQNFNAGGCFTPVGSGTVNTPGASNELAIYNSVTNAVFGSPNINFAPGSPGTLNVNGNVSADQYTGVGAYSVASTLPGSSPTPSSSGAAGFSVGTDGNFYLSQGNNSSTTSGPYSQILTSLFFPVASTNGGTGQTSLVWSDPRNSTSPAPSSGGDWCAGVNSLWSSTVHAIDGTNPGSIWPSGGNLYCNSNPLANAPVGAILRLPCSTIIYSKTWLSGGGPVDIQACTGNGSAGANYAGTVLQMCSDSTGSTGCGPDAYPSFELTPTNEYAIGEPNAPQLVSYSSGPSFGTHFFGPGSVASTGTATFSTASVTVAGVGVTWTSAMIGGYIADCDSGTAPGACSALGHIIAVPTSTSLTIDHLWTGNSNSAHSYTIFEPNVFVGYFDGGMADSFNNTQIQGHHLGAVRADLGGILNATFYYNTGVVQEKSFVDAVGVSHNAGNQPNEETNASYACGVWDATFRVPSDAGHWNFLGPGNCSTYNGGGTTSGGWAIELYSILNQNFAAGPEVFIPGTVTGGSGHLLGWGLSIDGMAGANLITCPHFESISGDAVKIGQTNLVRGLHLDGCSITNTLSGDLVHFFTPTNGTSVSNIVENITSGSGSHTLIADDSNTGTNVTGTNYAHWEQIGSNAAFGNIAINGTCTGCGAFSNTIAGGGTSTTTAAAGTVLNATSTTSATFRSVVQLGQSSTLTGTLSLCTATGSGCPIIGVASGSISGSLTIPDVASDSFAMLAATQTFTNKSIQMGQLTGPIAATTATETAVVRPFTYAGIETAALTYPWVFTNANSSTNNSSGALLVGTTGTSTGAVPLVVNEGTSAGDLLDMYNGGTVTAGAISGGTKEYAFGSTGVLTLGASAPGITTNGTTPYFNMNTLVKGAVNTCAPTSAVTLSGTTAIVCTWTLPNAAKTWFWQCSGTYSITAGTTPGLTLQMNAAQAPTNETGQAIIGSLAASGAITQTFQTGLGTSTSAGAQTIFADSPTVAITTVANAPWSTSGSIQASATSGTFAIQALLSGTGTPAGTINVGSGCTIQ